MGRRRIISEEIIERISKEMGEGLPMNYACDIVGIAYETAKNWINQGEIDYENEIDSLYCKFLIETKKGYAEYIKKCCSVIKAGKAGWNGTAWWLERTNKNFVLNKEGSDTGEKIIVNTKIKNK